MKATSSIYLILLLVGSCNQPSGRNEIPSIKQTGAIVVTGSNLTLPKDCIEGKKYIKGGKPIPVFKPFDGKYPKPWPDAMQIPAGWYLTADSLKLMDAKNDHAQAEGYRLVYVNGLVKLPLVEAVEEIRSVVTMAGYEVEDEGIDDYGDEFYKGLTTAQRKMAGRGDYRIGFETVKQDKDCPLLSFQIKVDQDMGEYTLFYGRLTVDLTP